MATAKPSAQITYVGHATTLIEAEGYRLLTDPLLRGRVAHLRRHTPLPHGDLTERIDAVILSHLHLDHCDLPSLRRLARSTRLIVPRGAEPLLARLGFSAIHALAPGETTHIGSLPITATPAQHSGFRPPLGPTITALGFLIGAERHIYFPGDTDIFPEMRDFAADLDTVLMPIWGWGSSLGPGHLDPGRAAEALQLLRPRLAIPIHWGTLYPFTTRARTATFLNTPPHTFARHAARVAPEVKVVIARPGERVDLKDGAVETKA